MVRPAKEGARARRSHAGEYSDSQGMVVWPTPARVSRESGSRISGQSGPDGTFETCRTDECRLSGAKRKWLGHRPNLTRLTLNGHEDGICPSRQSFRLSVWTCNKFIYGNAVISDHDSSAAPQAGRSRHPYAAPRTSLQCVCNRRRNCIGRSSPSSEYALGTIRDFPHSAQTIFFPRSYAGPP